MTIEDVLAARLETGQPVPTALTGAPYESWQVIHDDGRVEIGVWEVTPGSFRGSKEGVYESMHFVAGAGTITDEDGIVTEIRPGVVDVLPRRLDGHLGRARDDSQDLHDRPHRLGGLRSAAVAGRLAADFLQHLARDHETLDLLGALVDLGDLGVAHDTARPGTP